MNCAETVCTILALEFRAIPAYDMSMESMVTKL